MDRPRTIHTKSFEDRIEALSEVKLRQAAEMPHGDERDALEREARQLKTTSQLNSWLSSPGLRAPT